jgi:hypothetical protein
MAIIARQKSIKKKQKQKTKKNHSKLFFIPWDQPNSGCHPVNQSTTTVEAYQSSWTAIVDRADQEA